MWLQINQYHHYFKHLGYEKKASIKCFHVDSLIYNKLNDYHKKTKPASLLTINILNVCLDIFLVIHPAPVDIFLQSGYSNSKCANISPCKQWEYTAYSIYDITSILPQVALVIIRLGGNLLYKYLTFLCIS